MYGPVSRYADEIHQMKYRSVNETFEDAMNRIAAVLADNNHHFTALRKAMLHQRILFAGRVQAAVGSSRNITPFNCFVAPTIEDSFVDGKNSIMEVAHKAAATMRMGGGIGYDFSTLRHRGSLISKLGSQSSGAVSFMNIFNEICKCTSSSGHRRGAQMAVMRIDHPDIEEFINAKHNITNLTAFNTSIAITDEFMECVEADAMFHLKWDGVTQKSIRAVDLWNAVLRSTYDWAEPGVLFIDRINEMNNLWYCETIAATNPCAEQPLPPNGSCLLASMNLVKYHTPANKFIIPEHPVSSSNIFNFNFSLFREDIYEAVRALDNVIDNALFPLPEQKEEAFNKRRIGLGVTGVANAIEALGAPYGSPEFVGILEVMLRTLRDTAYRASINLAKEKGSFPFFDKDKYLQSGFVKTLPEDIREGIAEHGIRNSHLLSIAPTGTISLTADNVSSGIEPVFAHHFDRQIIEFNRIRTDRVHDYGLKYFKHRGRKCSEVSIKEHLEVLITAQRFIDSSISKTCNVPKDIEWEDFKNVYMLAWQEGCKGCTTYRVGGMREGVLTEVPEEQEEDLSCVYDPETGLRSCE